MQLSEVMRKRECLRDIKFKNFLMLSITREKSKESGFWWFFSFFEIGKIACRKCQVEDNWLTRNQFQFWREINEFSFFLFFNLNMNHSNSKNVNIWEEKREGVWEEKNAYFFRRFCWVFGSWRSCGRLMFEKNSFRVNNNFVTSHSTTKLFQFRYERLR